MRAQLKSIMSSDIDPATYWPDEEDNFGFYIQATIGPKMEKLVMCSVFKFVLLSGYLENFKRRSMIFGRHMLIVNSYDYEEIVRFISEFCHKVSGSNWSDVSRKMARYGYWEFEDYQQKK